LRGFGCSVTIVVARNISIGFRKSGGFFHVEGY
jgi:hypothetical protein